MEHVSLATEQEERELKRIGRQVARAIEPSDGRAIASARRKLFEPKEERSTNGRWVFALAGVGAVAATFFALRSDPAPAPSAAARGSERGASPATEGVRAADNATSRRATRPDGATELVLEQGEARGKLGAGTDVESISAGPYRVTGDARVAVTWSEADGLEVEVSDGEARVLAPGATTVIVSSGTSKKLPAKL